MNLFIFTVAITTASLLQLASTKPSFVVRIPNGPNVPDVPAVGHADPEGSTRETNAFGDDFQKAGKKWTVALCQMDSDGDGQTNGQELGDPCCGWVQTTNEVLRWTDSVSDPGVKIKVSSAKLLASVTCPGDSTASTPATSTATTTVAPTSMTSSTSSASAAPTPFASPTLTASSTNSSSFNSSAKATTTPSSSAVKAPTATPTPTSATAGLSLGFSALTLISGVALSAITVFQG